jgi:hypothetical protein
VILLHALIAVIHAILQTAASALLAGFSLLIIVLIALAVLAALIATLAGGLAWVAFIGSAAARETAAHPVRTMTLPAHKLEAYAPSGPHRGRRSSPLHSLRDFTDTNTIGIPRSHLIGSCPTPLRSAPRHPRGHRSGSRAFHRAREPA